MVPAAGQQGQGPGPLGPGGLSRWGVATGSVFRRAGRPHHLRRQGVPVAPGWAQRSRRSGWPTLPIVRHRAPWNALPAPQGLDRRLARIAEVGRPWYAGGFAAGVPSWEVWNPVRVPVQLSRSNAGGFAAGVPSWEVWNPVRVPVQLSRSNAG